MMTLLVFRRLGRLIFALSLVSGLVEASEGRTMTVDEMARRSDLVVLGRVVSLESTRDPGGHLFSKIELAASATWKGAPTGRLILVSGSAALGERWVRVVGEEPYRLGEEIVVFAVRNAAGEAVAVHPSQGKFRIHSDPVTGERHAENGVWGELTAQPAGGVRMPQHRRLSVDELQRQVKEAVR